MEKEMRYPEPGYARKLFSVYGVGLATLVMLGIFGLPWLKSWILQQIPLVQVLLAEVIAITFLLAFIPPCLFIIRTGKQVLKEDAYPHSRMSILYPTEIQHGGEASRRGKTLLWLGRFAIGAIVLGSCATHFICYKFLTNPMFFNR